MRLRSTVALRLIRWLDSPFIVHVAFVGSVLAVTRPQSKFRSRLSVSELAISRQPTALS
jgi:hypothetical protein